MLKWADIFTLYTPKYISANILSHEKYEAYSIPSGSNRPFYLRYPVLILEYSYQSDSVKASAPGLSRAKRSWFESGIHPLMFIGRPTYYLVVYKVTPLRTLAYGDKQKKVKRACHSFNLEVQQNHSPLLQNCNA